MKYCYLWCSSRFFCLFVSIVCFSQSMICRHVYIHSGILVILNTSNTRNSISMQMPWQDRQMITYQFPVLQCTAKAAQVKKCNINVLNWHWKYFQQFSNWIEVGLGLGVLFYVAVSHSNAFDTLQSQQVTGHLCANMEKKVPVSKGITRLSPARGRLMH